MDYLFEILPFIIAVIVFILRLLSGSTKKPQEPTTEPQKVDSLEDLFKQITKQIQEANQPKEKQDKSLQEQRLEHQQAKAQKEAQKIQENLDSLLVEKGITAEQRSQDQHFSSYKIQEASKNKFALLLKEKDNLKNALIINEILKPKHF